MLEMLGLLERFDLKSLNPESAEFIHLVSEASRLAYADRNAYIGDPAFIHVPVEGLLDDAYLASRSKLIDPQKAMESVEAGHPAGSVPAPQAVSPEGPHTSHFSIVDSYGNVVSMTTSVQIAYGSALMAGGFIINNELTDFETQPRQNGQPVANRPEGGKRPRSSMDPTIVFDAKDRPILAIGSPGGASIIGYVAQSVIAVLDQGLTVQQAVALPHHLAQRDTILLEAGPDAAAIEKKLEAMGHQVRVRPMDSGLHGIALHYGADGKVTLDAGVDPRREGEAARLPK
jgi:gamma-glutamyltranspeptidase/glutathione hydrolase